jgi:hypothetical protein
MSYTNGEFSIRLAREWLRAQTLALQTGSGRAAVRCIWTAIACLRGDN